MGDIQNILLKWGYQKSCYVLSVIAIASSPLITYLLMMLIWDIDVIDDKVLTSSLLVSVLVPAMVAPPILMFVLKLLFKVASLEKENRRLAHYDELTGLLSRRGFYMEAERQLAVAQGNNTLIAILIADLDGFKDVNDTYGHDVGDQVLKAVGSIIKQHARESDIIGRVGGDEFAFCLTGACGDVARQFGERLLSAVKNYHFAGHDQQSEVGVSIGLHVCENLQNNRLGDLIKQADMALYQAKAGGKAQLVASP